MEYISKNICFLKDSDKMMKRHSTDWEKTVKHQTREKHLLEHTKGA